MTISQLQQFSQSSLILGSPELFPNLSKFQTSLANLPRSHPLLKRSICLTSVLGVVFFLLEGPNISLVFYWFQLLQLLVSFLFSSCHKLLSLLSHILHYRPCVSIKVIIQAHCQSVCLLTPMSPALVECFPLPHWSSHSLCVIVWWFYSFAYLICWSVNDC